MKDQRDATKQRSDETHGDFGKAMSSRLRLTHTRAIIDAVNLISAKPTLATIDTVF